MCSQGVSRDMSAGDGQQQQSSDANCEFKLFFHSPVVAMPDFRLHLSLCRPIGSLVEGRGFFFGKGVLEYFSCKYTVENLPLIHGLYKQPKINKELA